MTWKHYLAVSAISLVLVLLLASFQDAPGYMDAEYYYSMGLRIAQGEGQSEPFVWNYLNEPTSLPQPAFTYWMPMPAFLAALGIWITGLNSFLGAKVVHLLLAAAVPALVMKLSSEMGGSVRESLLAGFFAVVPVFYNIFLGTTDSFAVTMLLGCLFLITARTEQPGNLLGLGGIAGLMHLTRADGLIWILAGIYCAARVEKKRVRSLLLVGAGYLLVMGPWFARNLLVLGQIMPSGTSKAFWLQEYNDLFLFSPARLTFKSWFSLGGSGIAANFLQAGLSNLRTALLVQGQVILAPFVLLGAWKQRRDIGLHAASLVWLALFLLMTFVFPFAGMRGGFLHSGAAWQPLAWVLAGSGFYRFISWGVEKRGWQKAKAGTVFSAALLVMLVIASFSVFYSRVIGGDFRQPHWNQTYLEALEIDQYLTGLGSLKDEPVLINNPPGLFAAAGRSSIVIPSDGLEAVLQAGKRFDAQYLVLEGNHPAGLHDLYLDPDSESGFDYLGKAGQALIFRLDGYGDGHE